MSFRITGLDPAPFAHLYGLPGAELATLGVRRVPVASTPGAPDRVELRDLAPGETALLLNYTHQPADGPYRACHAIYVREGAQAAFDAVDETPPALRIRPLSLRAFDAAGEMLDADLVDGAALAPAAERLLSDERVAYLHAHYAKRGCFAARIDRA